MPQVVFEPMIPVYELAEAAALASSYTAVGHAATVIGTQL
jgi:hypothetical protein